MGSYYIPSNKLKGESRILYIFTGKSLIYTAVGGVLGFIIFSICSALGAKTAGLIVMLIFAAIGYGVGTLKMPTSGNTRLTRNVSGESIDQIIVNYIKFKKNTKVYSYAVPRKDPDYMTINQHLNLDELLNNKNKGGK